MNLIKKTFLLYPLLLLIAVSAFAQDIPARPEPPRLVNDFTGLLNSGEADALERKLMAYNDSTSTQIVVAVVSSLNGYAVSDFSYRLAESWGIGQKGKNNGLLILIAPTERKMRIEVGYGLEAFVPDAKAKGIVDNIMKPRFKEGNYYQGIDEAINAIIDRASGTYTRDGSETDKKGRQGGSPFVWIIVIIIIILVIMNMRGGKGGYTSYSSGGAFFGGGGFGSGSSSGGSSFGGFGGGSFGGGGASGDW